MINMKENEIENLTPEELDKLIIKTKEQIKELQTKITKKNDYLKTLLSQLN